MKTIRFELTPEQVEQMKNIAGVNGWSHNELYGFLEIEFKEYPVCTHCRQELPKTHFPEKVMEND